MRITMMGTTGVGKTTYLVAMYNDLARKGRNGFKLKANKDIDVRLGNDWRDMVGSHSWPRPSDYYLDMEFELFFNTTKITDFNFVDYRGGAIKDLSDTDHAKKLTNDLLRSDALLILADSWFIANTEYDIADIQNEVNRIQIFIEDFFEKNPEKRLVLGVVLTKIDTIKHEQVDEFKERCFDLFNNVLDLAYRKQNQICGAFIPISVAGFNTVSIEVNEVPGIYIPQVNSKLNASPKPVHVHWPLLYCIARCMQFNLGDLNSQIENKTREVINLTSQIGLWDEITSFFRDEKSNRRKALDAKEILDNKRTEASQISEKLHPLLQEVDCLGELRKRQLYLSLNGHMSLK